MLIHFYTKLDDSTESDNLYEIIITLLIIVQIHIVDI